jgi:D-serine deaminase-like pyridoxal phosphate-dependent protein
MSLDTLDTPTLLIDAERLDRNVSDLAELCRAHGKALRPHAKTHKTVEIARRQHELGAVGLTVSKLGEAEVFAAAGFEDLFICYPLVGPHKLRRLVDLARRARISTIVDDLTAATALAKAAKDAGISIDVLIKLDVGMHRVGVAPENADRFAHSVAALVGVNLRGVCIHEGSVYGERDPERRRTLARAQVSRLVETAERLCAQGLSIEIVSSGATPAVRDVIDIDGLTEVRPGNYVFYDAMQVALGVTSADRCALSVLVTVVSRPAPDRGIVDAGSKALSLDRGAHGLELLGGYGRICERDDLTIVGLSEEHGWLRASAPCDLTIADRLRIIPNHACVVVNNFDTATVVREGHPIAQWKIAARGRMT